MTDTQVMAAPEPTQVDREAAADAYASVWWNSETPLMRLIREGKRDDDQMVQAFARHRLASSSPAAEPVGWMYEKDDRTCLWRDKAGPGEMCHGNGWTETPLYATPLPPPPAGDAELRKAAQALVDFNEGPAKEKRHDIYQLISKRIARALATPPSVPAQQGEEE